MLRNQSPRLLYLVPTFHNPSGTLLEGSDRRRLARAVAESNVTTVDDVTLADLDYGTPAPPHLAALEPDAPIITVGSISKVFWGGLRIGFIRAHPTVISHIAGVKAISDLGSNAPAQVSAVAMLEHYRGDKVVAESDAGRIAGCRHSCARRAPSRMGVGKTAGWSAHVDSTARNGRLWIRPAGHAAWTCRHRRPSPRCSAGCRDRSDPTPLLPVAADAYAVGRALSCGMEETGPYPPTSARGERVSITIAVASPWTSPGTTFSLAALLHRLAVVCTFKQGGWQLLNWIGSLLAKIEEGLDLVETHKVDLTQRHSGANGSLIYGRTGSDAKCNRMRQISAITEPCKRRGIGHGPRHRITGVEQTPPRNACSTDFAKSTDLCAIKDSQAAAAGLPGHHETIPEQAFSSVCRVKRVCCRARPMVLNRYRT